VGKTLKAFIEEYEEQQSKERQRILGVLTKVHLFLNKKKAKEKLRLEILELIHHLDKQEVDNLKGD